MKKLLLLILPFLLIVGCSNEDASPNKEDVTTDTEVVSEDREKEVGSEDREDKSETVANKDNVEETSTTTLAEDGTVNKKEIYIQKLKDVEADLAELEEIVENGNQSEMNQAQDEIYKKWDAALNEVYGVLEEELSKEEMDTLRVEQRKWMEERDAAADAAADEYKGGSIQPFVYSATLTKWTKERSYELVENYMG
jgi:uncharacterized protein YecT (DUF1311 family)